MDKKKMVIKIILIICIMVIIVGLIVVFTKREDTSEKVISKPLNEELNLEQVFEKVEQIEGMNAYISENDEFSNGSGENKKEYEVVANEIDFGKYEVLEKGAIVETTDEEVNEVWMIKLGDYDQQEEVCRILGNRVQKLKNAFEENDEQIKILQNAVIKQEDGIVIMIISPYVKTIEETIANEM